MTIETPNEKLSRLERMEKWLFDYEKWQADIIMDDECWLGAWPAITAPHYDRMMEMQNELNALIHPKVEPEGK